MTALTGGTTGKHEWQTEAWLTHVSQVNHFPSWIRHGTHRCFWFKISIEPAISGASHRCLQKVDRVYTCDICLSCTLDCDEMTSSSQCTGGIGTEILRAGPGSLALERNLWNAASCLAYLYYKSVLNLSLRSSLRNKTVKLSGKWTLKLDNLNFNFSNI